MNCRVHNIQRSKLHENNSTNDGNRKKESILELNNLKIEYNKLQMNTVKSEQTLKK